MASAKKHWNPILANSTSFSSQNFIPFLLCLPSRPPQQWKRCNLCASHIRHGCVTGDLWNGGPISSSNFLSDFPKSSLCLGKSFDFEGGSTSWKIFPSLSIFTFAILLNPAKAPFSTIDIISPRFRCLLLLAPITTPLNFTSLPSLISHVSCRATPVLAGIFGQRYFSWLPSTCSPSLFQSLTFFSHVEPPKLFLVRVLTGPSHTSSAYSVCRLFAQKSSMASSLNTVCSPVPFRSCDWLMPSGTWYMMCVGSSALTSMRVNSFAVSTWTGSNQNFS